MVKTTIDELTEFLIKKFPNENKEKILSIAKEILELLNYETIYTFHKLAIRNLKHLICLDGAIEVTYTYPNQKNKKGELIDKKSNL